MALGAADAKVTIVEYAAPTCPHCAAFNKDVFPRIKSEFIDTGKVRYVFREFPLNIKDLACAMLRPSHRRDDFDQILRRRRHHVPAAGPAGGENLRHAASDRTAGRPQQAGGRGLPEGPGDAGQDQRREKYAEDVLKVEGTPTFFINGDEIVGEAAFEEFEKRIKTLLKG